MPDGRCATKRGGSAPTTAALCAAVALALLPACSGVGHRLRFAQKPAAVSGEGFSMPVAGEVSSPFGRRTFGGSTGFHDGVDLTAAAAGSPVFAAKGGVVTVSAWSRSYGLWIEIRHAGGWVTRYAHLSRRGVGAGRRVRRGEVIGQVGSTGRATGAHLHFEVSRGGTAVDPVSVLPAGDGGVGVPRAGAPAPGDDAAVAAARGGVR